MSDTKATFDVALQKAHQLIGTSRSRQQLLPTYSYDIVWQNARNQSFDASSPFLVVAIVSNNRPRRRNLLSFFIIRANYSLLVNQTYNCHRPWRLQLVAFTLYKTRSNRKLKRRRFSWKVNVIEVPAEFSSVESVLRGNFESSATGRSQRCELPRFDRVTRRKRRKKIVCPSSLCFLWNRTIEPWSLANYHRPYNC